MRVCAVCGGQVPEPDARFCGTCGAPMAAQGQQPAPMPPPTVLAPGVQARRPGESTPVPRPVSRPTDSVSTTLQPTSVSADPGAMVAVTLRARNTGTVVDELRIAVEGPIASWAEVETPVLRLMPGTDATSAIRLRPPLQPLALAGPVPFLVRVTSHEHPSEEATESGVLTVGELRSLAATVVPTTAKASGTATYEVRVENRGNRPVEVMLAATDPDEALRLELDPAPQVVPAGGQLRTALRVTPRTSIALGASERRTFKVDAVADGRPGATAGATLVQTARFPRWLPTVAMAAAGVAVLAVASFAFGVLPPKAPESPGLVANATDAPSGVVSPSVPPASDEPPSAEPPSSDPSAEPASPTPDPTPTPSPTPLPPGACVDGYDWRLITVDDKACVTTKTVKQARADEAAASARWVDGAYGPQTCISGYVWREAFPADLVCVTADVRATTILDSERAPFRVAPRTDTCIEGFVWREATPEDHVCVDKAVRNSTIADTITAAQRWYDGAYGPQTCIDGYWWRQVIAEDYVCVDQATKDQIAIDNAQAQSRIAGS